MHTSEHNHSSYSQAIKANLAEAQKVAAGNGSEEDKLVKVKDCAGFSGVPNAALRYRVGVKPEMG